MFYGKPSDEQIEAYIVELTELLIGGHLASVDYGFRRSDGWVVALSYTVRADGTIATDDRAGRVPVGGDVSNASWYSYLRYSSKWWEETQAQRDHIIASIPLSRGTSDEPEVGSGNVWVSDKVYTSNGTSFTRRTLKSL